MDRVTGALPRRMGTERMSLSVRVGDRVGSVSGDWVNASVQGVFATGTHVLIQWTRRGPQITVPLDECVRVLDGKRRTKEA